MVEEVSVGDKPVIESILSTDISVNITDTKAVTGCICLGFTAKEAGAIGMSGGDVYKRQELNLQNR